MKFLPFYLFYILTIILFSLGFLTRDVDIVAGSWHVIITKGMWTFFIPTAIGALLTGLIYQHWFNTGKVVPKGTVLFHFALVTLGLYLSLNIYQMTAFLLSSDMPDAISFRGDHPFLFIFPGPVLLITAFIVFVVGLVKARRKPE